SPAAHFSIAHEQHAGAVDVARRATRERVEDLSERPRAIEGADRIGEPLGEGRVAAGTAFVPLRFAPLEPSGRAAVLPPDLEPALAADLGPFQATDLDAFPATGVDAFPATGVDALLAAD